MVIITVCKSGRHRSTSNAELVRGRDVSGGRCEQCSWQVGKEEGEQAYSDSVALWKECMPQVWRPKRSHTRRDTASNSAAASSSASAARVVTPQAMEATTSSKASAPSRLERMLGKHRPKPQLESRPLRRLLWTSPERSFTT